MPFPSGTPVVTLTGNIPSAVGGSGFTGRIILTPSAVLTDSTHKAVYPGGGPVTFDTNGVFTVQVIPNDAAGILPVGWKWHVDLQPAGGQRVTFWTDIPTAAGPTVDLSTLVPTSAPDGSGQSHPPSGPAGGALTGSYPNPQLSSVTIASFDQAGAASAALTSAQTYADGKLSKAANPIANVRDYGAIGDGSVNDTAAIASAIAALPAGGTLYLPQGTYVTTGILIQGLSNFTVRGERGAVLTLAANMIGAPNRGAANVLTVADCTDFAIEGLSIDGRRDTLFPLAPLAANATAGQPSVQIAHGAAAAYVVGQRLNLNGGLTVSSGSEANRQDQQLAIQSITPGAGAANDVITFTTNLANAYSFAAGTLSDGYGPYAANGAYITPWQTGNATVAGRALAEEDQQNGIHLLNCRRFRIAGCNIHNVWESPIRCGTHNLAGGAQADGCSYGTITGNALWHAYDQGVGLWCSSNMAVTGNTITSAGWAGICMTVSDDCTISGNTSSDNVQRIPNDVQAGYGIAIEGGARNTVSGNLCSNNYGSAVFLTAGGTLPFGGPVQQATQVAAGSNAVALPAGTVNVASTAGFASAGQFTVLSSAGAQQMTYTGKTGTSFTGCTGGIGTLYTGQKLTQYPVFTANGAALEVASLTTTVSDGTKFQVGGRYSIVDGPRTERVDVTAIAGNVITFAKATAYRHADKVQFSQAIAEDNEIIGNACSGGHDIAIRLPSAVRTTISNNVVNRAGLRGIDLVAWTFGGLQPPFGTIVSGNMITAPDAIGDGSSYQAIAASQCSDLQILNNRCAGAPSTQGYYTALFLAAVTDSVVAGNVIADAYAIGLQLNVVNEWVCKRVQVAGNEILRCFGEGLLLYGGTNLNVKNNIITGCAANNGPGGFGGALDIRGVTYSQISDNVVINNGHGGIGLDSATINGATVNCAGNVLAGNISGDDGLNYDPYNGAHTQQGYGIKELAAGQGPNTYLNNTLFGTGTNFNLTSTGNSVNAVDLTTDQTIQGNKTFSYYTTLQDGQVNGAWRMFGTVGFFGAAAVGRQPVAGAKGGNAALASMATALANLGLITDSTTA
ncbi:right-handed parallel beta-helix repeat-containing protein [Streptomyces sp. NBC_01384]|uniref:right-handed parallel beta-helix repeat-containing protein n=1 Tax=Streptomyces sp. NBC_01384 TaxID=2903847 RepID=UPI0032534342